MKYKYICSLCHTTYSIVPEIMVCPSCVRQQEVGQPLRGVLEVMLRGRVEGPSEFQSLLPVESEYFPPIPVGDTPLWEVQNLRRETGFPSLYIKDDGSNPTCSFKDRASYLVSAFAKKFGIEEVVVASTGNAGSSMAGVGAAAGQKVTLFLPRTAPKAKLVQALQYGAQVYRVDGSYDQAYDLSLDYSTRFGGMNRNTAYNPMTIEGKKTVSLELFKQLGRPPDVVFVAVGDGCILSGVYKGFRDLKQFDLIQTIPRVIGVQAQTSDALFRAFKTGKFENKPTSTVADSICVDVPRNGIHALAQLKQFGGEMITVSDDDIIDAQATLSRTTGLFSEPAGAAAFAGFLKTTSNLDPENVVVILSTGNGLKDSAAATRGIHVSETLVRSIDDIS